MAFTIQDQHSTDTPTPTPSRRPSRKAYPALAWVAVIAAVTATVFMVGAVLAGSGDERPPAVIERLDASPLRIDAKDHPRYGSATERDVSGAGAAPARIDAKDHPRYGSVTRAGARADARGDGCFVFPHGIVRC